MENDSSFDIRMVGKLTHIWLQQWDKSLNLTIEMESESNNFDSSDEKWLQIDYSVGAKTWICDGILKMLHIRKNMMNRAITYGT